MNAGYFLRASRSESVLSKLTLAKLSETARRRVSIARADGVPRRTGSARLEQFERLTPRHRGGGVLAQITQQTRPIEVQAGQIFANDGRKRKRSPEPSVQFLAVAERMVPAKQSARKRR